MIKVVDYLNIQYRLKLAMSFPRHCSVNALNLSIGNPVGGRFIVEVKIRPSFKNKNGRMLLDDMKADLSLTKIMGSHVQ